MRKGFQGLCLVNEEGWEHMHSYDDHSPYLREQLRNSPWNLCPSCASTITSLRMMEDQCRKDDRVAKRNALLRYYNRLRSERAHKARLVSNLTGSRAKRGTLTLTSRRR